MIKALLTGIINLLISLVNIVLLPLDTIINNNIPVLTDAFTAINLLFDKLVDFVGWVVDASCLPPLAIEIIVSTLTAHLTIPFLVHAIKMVIKWYDKMKV